MANTVDHSGDGIQALYPAVIQCFSVIILGYLAGKWGLVSGAETKGLNTFIGSFSLPALVFISIAQLDLGSVNWPFILGIALGKTTVFLIVLLICLLVTKECDKSGLFAIFCSQSNDFAMGYPILYALYGKEYADYLYLLGPVSLVFLNPIGFVFMEISKQNRVEGRAMDTGAPSPPSKTCTLGVMKKVVVGVCLNPVVLMTALGIAANFIFHHSIPQTIAGVLTMLGSAFSASALFSLGLTMVGSAASLKGPGFVVPGILIALKLIFLPVISREFVNVLNPPQFGNDTVTMANYAFLYGTLPTAPGVFVFACQYEIYVEMIAGAMVACTFISAPLMFLASSMISLKDLDPSDYIGNFEQFLLNISIVGIVTAMWVVVVFVLSEKWKRVPHCITLCLVLSQVVACLGGIVWCIFGVDVKSSIGLYFQFALFYFGILSTRVWTALLATTLVFVRCRSVCFLLRMRPWLTLIGWGIPAVITAVLLLTVGHETEERRQNPLFQYGKSQASVSALVLVVCFVVTVGCLVLQQRYERKWTQFRTQLTDSQLPPPQLLDEDEEELLGNEENSNGVAAGPSLQCGGCPQASTCTNTNLSQIEDLVESDEESLLSYSAQLCSPSKHPCDARQRTQCRSLVQQYRAANPQVASDADPDELQLLRHIVLLILLSISMFVGIALCVWTLVMETLSGIYVELMFLDAGLNFGQGFLSFMLFGLTWAG